MARIYVEMAFEFSSAFHTSGNRAELWVDKCLNLEDGELVIPATSIKGWMRENAEKTLRGLGCKVCDGSTPRTQCGECIVCKVFGSYMRRAPVRFHDARVREGYVVESRTGVSLSRFRRTALERRLFTQEAAWVEEVKFTVDGFFPSEEEAKSAVALLWLSAKVGVAMGASKTRGLGWLSLREFKAKVDGREVGEEEVASIVEGWVQ